MPVYKCITECKKMKDKYLHFLCKNGDIDGFKRVANGNHDNDNSYDEFFKLACENGHLEIARYIYYDCVLTKKYQHNQTINQNVLNAYYVRNKK